MAACSQPSHARRVCLIDGQLMTDEYFKRGGICAASDQHLFPWQGENATYQLMSGIPGLGSGVINRNAPPHFTKEGESISGVKGQPEVMVVTRAVWHLLCSLLAGGC